MTIRPALVPGIPDDVEVRRSDRRRRSVSAFREGGRTIVVVPSRMSVREAARHANELHARLQRKALQVTPTDDDLALRAAELSHRFLPGAPTPSSIRWNSRQQSRWGSCTSLEGTIRLSTRLQGMPDFVVDYVIVHELSHLLVPDHGPRFQQLVNRYPDTARAVAFLEGFEFAKANLSSSDVTPSDARTECVVDVKEPKVNSDPTPQPTVQRFEP